MSLVILSTAPGEPARALRAVPALAGRFALDVELTRHLTAADWSIDSLIAGGQLALGWTLALSDAELAAEGRSTSRSLERLFARSVEVTLAYGRRVLASTRASGVAPSGVLEGALAPADVVEVLAAIDGGGAVELRARVEYASGADSKYELLECPLSSLIAGDRDAVTLRAPRGASAGSARTREVPPALIRHDLSLPLPSDPLLPLPVVTTGAESSWVDRTNALHFVAPIWSVVSPPAGVAVTNSPFSLQVHRISPAAGTGAAGLVGTLRVSFSAHQPPESSAALVAFRNVTAVLEVPYRFAADPVTRTQAFTGEVTMAGASAVATFVLADDWVRLAYTALSVVGVFDQPLRVQLGYAFSAYVPIFPQRGPLPLLDKAALTPITVSKLTAAAQPMLGADGTMHVRTAPSAFTQSGQIPHVAPQPRSISALGTTTHPQLTLSPTAIQALARVPYVIQTILRSQVVDVAFPCTQYGALYVDDGVAIGCSDAFRLSETSVRLYDELTAIAHPRYRVWQSLREPGNFLIVPSAYRVGRYPSTEPAARRYLPQIAIYALIGATPDTSSYWITASLIPDLTVAERMVLLDQLAPYVRDGRPALQFATDPAVAATLNVRWVLPDAIATPQVTSTGDSLEVGISTDLASGVVLRALVERSGLRAGATFTLPDGTALQTELVVDTSLVGPADTGPVALARDGGVVVLDNCVLQAVDVQTLAIRNGASVQLISGDRTLAPGETARIAAPAGDAMWIEHEPTAPGPLDEIGVFEEEVSTNLVFVELARFSEHQIAKLRVFVRIVDTTTLLEADLPELGTANLPLVLPLTKYLDGQVVDLQVVVVGSDGTQRTGDWFTWDLVHNGCVVSITPALIP